MARSENVGAISPLSQQYPDMTRTHTLLRDPITFIKMAGSIANALSAVHTLHALDLKEGEKASLPKPRENPLARIFLNTKVTDTEHWKALFQLLQNAGYSDKYELQNKASEHINRFVHSGKPISQRAKEDIGEQARHGLEAAFAGN